MRRKSGHFVKTSVVFDPCVFTKRSLVNPSLLLYRRTETAVVAVVAVVVAVVAVVVAVVSVMCLRAKTVKTILKREPNSPRLSKPVKTRKSLKFTEIHVFDHRTETFRSAFSSLTGERPDSEMF